MRGDDERLRACGGERVASSRREESSSERPEVEDTGRRPPEAGRASIRGTRRLGMNRIMAERELPNPSQLSFFLLVV